MSEKSYALTTAQRAADFAGLGTLTGTNLTIMENMVNQVTSFIETETGRRFQKTTYTQEEYDTEDSQTLILKNFPIISSETFLLERRNSSLNEDAWETVDGLYYYVDYDSGVIKAAGGIRFAVTIRGYRVTYTAGYDFDNSTNYLSDTEAGDIEMAAWMLLEAVWNKKKGSQVQSEKIGDYSVVFKKTMLDNEDISAIIDGYKMVDDVAVMTPFQS